MRDSPNVPCLFPGHEKESLYIVGTKSIEDAYGFLLAILPGVICLVMTGPYGKVKSASTSSRHLMHCPAKKVPDFRVCARATDCFPSLPLRSSEATEPRQPHNVCLPSFVFLWSLDSSRFSSMFKFLRKSVGMNAKSHCSRYSDIGERLAALLNEADKAPREIRID